MKKEVPIVLGFGKLETGEKFSAIENVAHRRIAMELPMSSLAKTQRISLEDIQELYALSGYREIYLVAQHFKEQGFEIIALDPMRPTRKGGFGMARLLNRFVSDAGKTAWLRKELSNHSMIRQLKPFMQNGHFPNVIVVEAFRAKEIATALRLPYQIVGKFRPSIPKRHSVLRKVIKARKRIIRKLKPILGNRK